MRAHDSRHVPMPLRMDDITRGLVTVTPHEKAIHSGEHWYVKTWLDLPEETTEVLFMFRTPPLPVRIHAAAHIASETEMTANIFYDAAVSDVGTPVPYFNNDHGITGNALLVPTANPTVTDYGTLTWASRLGIGNFANVAINYEIMAKPDSNYIWQLQKSDKKAAQVDIDFWWWEESPYDPTIH